MIMKLRNMITNSSGKKIIVGLVSEMGGGKGTAAKYLKDKYGAETFRFSTMLRDVLKRMHLSDERENLQTLSTILRQAFGDDIMSQVITKDAEESQSNLVITEGIRRPGDIVYLERLGNFYLISLEVDQKLRYERITKRGENADDSIKTWEEFLKQSQAESEQKIREVMSKAKYTIDNNGDLDNFHKQIDEVLEKIRKI